MEDEYYLFETKKKLGVAPEKAVKQIVDGLTESVVKYRVQALEAGDMDSKVNIPVIIRDEIIHACRSNYDKETQDWCGKAKYKLYHDE